MTPLADKFLNLILSYTRIFLRLKDFKQHLLKSCISSSGTFSTGTEIYLCGLKESFNSYENDIFMIEERKKKDLALMT